LARGGLLASWLTKRRRSKSIDLAYRQMKNSVETVNELKRCLSAVIEDRLSEARKSIERLFLMEADIDELRRRVFAELSREEEASKFREDLMRLVWGLDVMADHVKDSARNLLILLDENVSPDLWGKYLKLVEDLVSCAQALLKAIEALAGRGREAIRYIGEVDRFEERVDEQYLAIRRTLIKSEDLKPGVLMALRDLLEFLERAADMCADTADYVRLLLV